MSSPVCGAIYLKSIFRPVHPFMGQEDNGKQFVSSIQIAFDYKIS